jgi:hypothetical protein
MGQVVEDQDQVGLLEGGHGDADRVAVRQRHSRLESGDRVVGERADRPAREARNPLVGQDAALRQEVAQCGERVWSADRLRRQVRGEVEDTHRPGLDRGLSVADRQQAPRPDSQERVSTEPLATFDGLEQEGRAPVVEAHEGADRGLEVRIARGREKDRVG